MKKKVVLLIATLDAEMLSIIKDYWEFKIYKFKHSISDLEEKYDKELIYSVSDYSYAYIEGLDICNNCGASLRYKHRSYLGQAIIKKIVACKKCQMTYSIGQIKSSFEINLIGNSNETEKYILPDIEKNVNVSIEKSFNDNDSNSTVPSKEKLLQMMDAFEKEKYLFLIDINFYYLVAFCEKGDKKQAAILIGISEMVAEKIFNLIVELNLVCPISNYILPELKKLLLAESSNNKCKNIFGNGPKMHELFIFLKKTNINVFPKIPISHFVKQQFVEQHFEEYGDEAYFITTLVDFVVTERDGMPRFAVDYVSTAFEDASKMKKLLFRKKILMAAGINHFCVNSTDLSRMKQNKDLYQFPEDLLNP